MGRSGKGIGKGCFALFGIAFSVFLLFSAKSPSALILSAAIHEAGHIACGFFLSGQLPYPEIKTVGIRLCYPSLPSAFSKAAVSMSGPALSLISGVIFKEYEMFSLYCIFLGIINLLPCKGLDGGNILGALCEKYFDAGMSQRTVNSISSVSILLFFGLNCAVQLKYGTNISLAVLSVFLTVSVLGRE